MSFALTVLIFSIIVSLGARQPDIDINRIQLLPKQGFHGRPLRIHNHRRSIISDQKSDDNDYYSSRLTELRPQARFLYNSAPATEAKGKVYQPREDPRTFYQSDAYTQEVNRKNLNNEVSSIYLSRGLVRANEGNLRSLPLRVRDYRSNKIDKNICVRCPYDRTLIVKAGVDRALLEKPRILTCSGKKATKDVHFVHMYGPKLGSLLTEGSHMVVGRLKHKNEILQTCKMQIHVIMQSCPVPKYLEAQCGAENKTCDFTCKDPKAELHGYTTLTCEDNMQWSRDLPICSVRRWCAPPVPPNHGKVSCKGATAVNGWGLTEGASCRLRCERGWRWSPRTLAICRKGLWSHDLKCQPKRSR